MNKGVRLEKFKERDNKRIGIIVFTVMCILLVSGVILYRTFAIFEVNKHFNVIEGEVQGMGDVEFAFYIDGSISKTVPENNGEYSLDTSASKCIDMTTGEQISNVNWDNENWEVRLKGISTTKTKCYLYFKKIYKEEALNGAIPDLGNGRLIPVTILSNEAPTDSPYPNGHSGKVEKADITQAWYSYKDKQWANAVILKDGKVDDYQPGDEIQESEIESYFVWIPRYSYKLKNDESVYNGYTTAEMIGKVTDVNDFYKQHSNQATNNAFEITFETKNSGIKNGTSKGSAHTHPAFVAFDSNGFWVGKFETGYNGAINVAGAQKNTQESDKIIIKPNTFSWRNIQVANAFYTAYNYKRELESHLMKNTEWGAVAYLTQSKYGRCTEKDGTSTCEEVKINNNSNYITGYSAKNDPTCGRSCYNETDSTELNKDGEKGYSYYNFKSQASSTTGNYYGIYDMSGGAWEYVMGVMQGADNNALPSSGRDKEHNSGFNGLYTYCEENGNNASNAIECGIDIAKNDGYNWPSSKYYDLYDYISSEQDYQRGILGDATKEMGPFYSIDYSVLEYIGNYNADYAGFVWPNASWFLRGGSSAWGADDGIFSMYHQSGETNSDISFRIILTP